MKLAKEQFLEFAKSLSRRLPPHRACSLCGGKHFSISSCVMNILSYIDIETIDGGLHVVPLVCETCGNVFFICPEVLEGQRIDDLCCGTGVLFNENGIQER